MKNEVLNTWQKIYQEWFGMEINVADLQVPEVYNPEKHFSVLVDQGITINAVVSAMRKRFNVSLHIRDFDIDVAKNDRTSEAGNYLVLFNRNIEADEEFKNMSADDLVKKEHRGITLLERLLLVVLYYSETDEHLDVINWTLCSGSRLSVRRFPCVRWSSAFDRIEISWRDFDCSEDYLRSRAVVS